MVFYFKTETNKKFGCYINEEINDFSQINDKEAFTFTLNSERPLKCEIVNSEYAIRIYPPNDNILLTIGDNDIVIMKQNCHKKSKSDKEKKTYNYQEKENILVDGDDEFIINHIQVFQMEEMSDEKKLNLEKIKTLSEAIRSNPPEEMKHLEHWTFSKYDSLLFDSDYCDWKQNTSTFGDCLINKNNFVILIESMNGTKYGGYVEEKITNIGKRIEDEHTFLFTFKDKRPQRFDILKKEDGFRINSIQDTLLFSFGLGDLRVFKSDIKKEIQSVISLDSYLYSDEKYPII